MRLTGFSSSTDMSIPQFAVPTVAMTSCCFVVGNMFDPSKCVFPLPPPPFLSLFSFFPFSLLLFSDSLFHSNTIHCTPFVCLKHLPCSLLLSSGSPALIGTGRYVKTSSRNVSNLETFSTSTLTNFPRGKST